MPTKHIMICAAAAAIAFVWGFQRGLARGQVDGANGARAVDGALAGGGSIDFLNWQAG